MEEKAKQAGQKAKRFPLLADVAIVTRTKTFKQLQHMEA
jgi:hypothetical protein